MTDLFSEKAQDWDKDEMKKQLSSAIGSEILKQIPVNKSMKVMDFGAGTGLITYQIAPHVNKVVAVDISEAMLSQLMEKFSNQNNVEMCCQNIIDEPINKTFDLIMSAMAMHHVEDTNKLIQRFSENATSGAMLALADLDSEDGSFHPAQMDGIFHHGFDRDELKAILEKHNFTNVNFSTAHTINKEDKTYPIFLLTASKK
jgi:putative AdoMet-dependent methyltransferase